MNVEQFLNQKPARAAARSGIAYFADFFDRCRLIFRDYRLHGFFRHAETGADQSLFAREFFYLKRAKILQRRLESVETNLGAMFSAGGKFAERAFDFPQKFRVIQAVKLGQPLPDDFAGQNFGRRNRKAAPVCFISGVADFFRRPVDFQKNADKRPADKARARAGGVRPGGFSGLFRRGKKFVDLRRIKTHAFNF